MAEFILVVEDEEDLARALVFNLEQAGYRAQSVSDGRRALALTREKRPDLVILDVMLPDISGIEICRLLRQSDELASMPVLMLTARAAEIDRIVGFESGADDYVTKPFSMRELLLRVKSLLRRSRGQTETRPTCFGCLKLDPEAHRAEVGGKEVRLTALEFKLLSHLLSRRGRVQSRERLLSDVWGIDADVTTRTVDTHVKRLREKLGPAGDYLETLRGVGYRLVAEPPEEDR